MEGLAKNAEFQEGQFVRKLRSFGDSELHGGQGQIGHGGFGRVFHRKWIIGQHEIDVAEKILIEQRIDAKYARSLLNEAEMLCMVEHKHVVKLLGVRHTDHSFSLIMEYIKHGSCMDFFNSVRLDPDHLWPLKYRIAMQVSETMEYLHAIQPKRILHLDLKSANVLLDGMLNVKLCDFGLCQLRTMTQFATSIDNGEVSQQHQGGTITHIAPEHLKNPNTKPTTKSDVYGYSVFVWELITEKQPYENASLFGNSLVLLKDHIVKGCRPDTSDIPVTTPRALLTVVNLGWKPDRSTRPEFSDITKMLKRNSVYQDITMSRVVSDILVAWVPKNTRSTFDDSGAGDTQLNVVQSFSLDLESTPEETKDFLRHPGNEVGAFAYTNTPVKLVSNSMGGTLAGDSGLYSIEQTHCGGNSPTMQTVHDYVNTTESTESTPLLSEGNISVRTGKRCISKVCIVVIVSVVLLILLGVAAAIYFFVLKRVYGPAACAKLDNGECIKWNFDICYGNQTFDVCTPTGKIQSCCSTTKKDRLNEDKWRDRDHPCRRVGGNCQLDSNSCLGQYTNLLCGGPSNRVCCIGHYKSTDVKCEAIGGRCVDWRYHVCTAGYEQNLCGGDNNRRCCMYCDYLCYANEEKYKSLICDQPCTNRGGSCQNSSNYCNSVYTIGSCCGKNGRSCCLNPIAK